MNRKDLAAIRHPLPSGWPHRMVAIPHRILAPQDGGYPPQDTGPRELRYISKE